MPGSAPPPAASGEKPVGGAWDGPAVGLLDLDAFFASVEQLDHPEWRGKPVIVGGDATSRGVVSTASYEARAFGVHSAMPSAQARRLCPDAIWTRGHFDRYREMSAAVMDVVLDETPYVEQVSVDEAFFDVTPGRFSREDPVAIVRRIGGRVARLGVTCSIGLSTSKTVAKIASERDKPNGVTVVYPGEEADFLAPMPVRAMSGVGRATEERLARLGIKTLGQLARADPASLRRAVGVVGPRLAIRAAGMERSPVRRADKKPPAKSVSCERTFAQDLLDQEDVSAALSYLCELVARRLRAQGLAGRTVTLRVDQAYGASKTTSVTLDGPVDTRRDIQRAASGLLPSLWKPGGRVRLMGVGVSGFDREAPRQLSLFGPEDARAGSDSGLSDQGPSDEEGERQERLAKAADLLRDKYGDKALMSGSEMLLRGRATGTAPGKHLPGDAHPDA